MKFALVLAASVLSLSALSVQASAPVDVASVTVSYADLDLNRMPGVVVLYRRIRGAAEHLCSPVAGETLSSKHTYMTCFTQSVSTAIARIDSLLLSDYAAQQLAKPAYGSPKLVAGR